MSNHGKSKLVENVLILALIGILAGVAGGFAIGLVSQHTSSTSSPTH
jgi:NhaP-type Na+/H+ or K+/H+ antiporter